MPNPPSFENTHGDSISPKEHFRLHWLDGSTNDVYGNTIEDAMNKAGFGGGSIRALDYWEKVGGDES